MRLICSSILFIVLSCSALGTYHCHAQKVGDRVVVTAEFDTKIYKEKVDKVYPGEIRTLIQIQKEWCALKDVKGWLPLRNVMSLKSAMTFYNQRLRKNKSDFVAYAHRGKIHYENGDYEKALIDLDRSVRLNGNMAGIWNERGIVLKGMGRYSVAVKDFTKAIELSPGFAKAYANRGLLFQTMNRDKDAISDFDQAIKLNSDDPWNYINRGSSRLSLGDSDSAEKDYNKAISLNPKLGEPYIGISNVYLSRDDLQKAYKYAAKALEVQPKNSMALNARGWVNYQMERLDDALSDFTLSIRFTPKLPISYNNRGVVYAAQQEFDKAINDYSKSIKLSNDYSPVGYSNRGTAWFGRGNFAKADADYKRAIKDAPQLVDALNAHAWFQATCPEEKYRDATNAVKNAKLACEITRFANWAYVDTLAAAYAEAGNFEKAIENAKKALDLAPEKEIDDIKKRIESFESKQPIRSTRGRTSKPRRRRN